MNAIVDRISQPPRRGLRAASGTAAAAYRTALELRYQVYCIECNFLSPDDYPDGVETDEHDDDAAHFYAFDARDELVGYVRLIRPDGQSGFPIQRYCRIGVGAEALPPANQAAEISRLMVRSDYRRRRGDRLSGVTASQNRAAFVGERRHEAPQILLSLYRQMYAYCREHGIRYWYAAMERSLARSLARLDFAFDEIGPETDYYGPVSPYVADLRVLESRLGRCRPELLQWLQRPEHAVETSDHVDDLGVEIDATPETTTGEARRRVSRIATLDGGVVVNDAGFSDGDRTIDVAWASAPAVDAAVARMLVLYDRATLSTPIGVFTVAPETYTPGGAESTLRALVLKKISA